MQQTYVTVFTGMLEFSPKLSIDGEIKKEMEAFIKDPINYIQQQQQQQSNTIINQDIIGECFRRVKCFVPNCPLIVSSEGITIAPSNNNAVQYLDMFINLFLLPNDINLNGSVDAIGSEIDDRWILQVKNNVISIVKYLCIVEKKPSKAYQYS